MEEALLKRVLPHSMEAEQSVLGAMKLSNMWVYVLRGKSNFSTEN